MSKAQSYATAKARKVLIKAIEEGDISTAKWWLERKARDEFSKHTRLIVVDNHENGKFTDDDLRTGMETLKEQWIREYESQNTVES